VEKVALEVSDPRSPRYGQYLSRDELRALVSAPAHVTERVVTWLRDEAHPGEPLRWEDRADHLMVETTVRNVETLFDTSMATFQRRGLTPRIAITQSATVPTEVAKLISHIYGLDNLKPAFKIKPHGTRMSTRSITPATPSNIKAQYNVSTSLRANTSLTQAVVEFGEVYSRTGLRSFEQAFDLPTVNITSVGDPSCLASCAEGLESDLDTQYITAMGTGVPTLFDTNDEAVFIYAWASSVAARQVRVADIYSISYSAADWDSTWNAEEGALAQLATMGITVFVASGDFGAASDSFQGVNTSIYCPFGGCLYNSTMCGQFNYVEDGTISMFPSVAFTGPYLPSGYFSSFMDANAACEFAYDEDSLTSLWVHTNCSCSDLNYGTYGTTESSIEFREYQPDSSLYPILSPGYPASSAWVTAVGATNYEGPEEVPATYLNTGFTSGGGFSFTIPQPSWQTSAVQRYLNNPSVTLPNSTFFNAYGRAVPDIALRGDSSFKVFTSTGFTYVGGTSASSPCAAGLFALINDARKQQNLPQLGFLNPTLYQLAASHPEVFNDITEGNNKGTETFVGLYGFESAPGWDPVTGFGSFNFGLLYEHLVPSVSPSPLPSGSGTRLNSLLGMLISLLCNLLP